MAEVIRLLLGPVVGHTDQESARIWIRVRGGDDPALYSVTVHTVGEFGFASTEVEPEFGTAVAVATGLRANHPYRYTVRRLGRALSGASGSFQTMPPPEYLNELSFVVVSCNSQDDLGAWTKLRKFIEDTQPQFLLMIGDQIYADEVWDSLLEGDASERRQRIADIYQKSWSRDDVGQVLANIPCYMMWDDHDVRDGWGSFAPDSPTLGERYPLGRPIHEKYFAYFRDARDVCWHFQIVNAPTPLTNAIVQRSALSVGLPPYAVKNSPSPAMPFVFRVGRVAIVVTDSRGDRDLWRAESPVLGAGQWTFLESVIEDLPADVDALAMVTTVPIVSGAPHGQAQLAAGSRTDDVSYLRDGDEDALKKMFAEEGKGLENLPGLLVVEGSAAAGVPVNVGRAVLGSVDDARDQWAHYFSRPEQERLIRLAVHGRTTNRTRGSARGLLFVGGDLHSGGVFTISLSDPEVSFECLISSGVSQTSKSSFPGLVGTLVDEDFDVADGIHASLTYLVNNYNFGVAEFVPYGRSAHINAHVVHTGEESDVWGVRLKIERPKAIPGIHPGLPFSP
jgi:hypothetical protein